MTLAEKQVAEAMEILDHETPGWDRFINLAKFNIFSNSDCILGQLFAAHPRFEDVPFRCCRYCCAGSALFGRPGLIPIAFAAHQYEWIAAIRERREGTR